MRSHFLPSRGVAAACAVAGATTLLNGKAAAQALVAADYATNSTYSAGWSAGQNGGNGFGPWSFDGTDASPAGQYQGMSTSSPLGRSWTLATYNDHTGLANAGRAITEPGGLQPGQTLEMVMANPIGYHFYRGFDICCLNGTDNNPGGDNTAALRTQVFAYFNTAWDVVDDNTGGTLTPLDVTNTADGMVFDLTLTSTTTYSLTLTPLSDPSIAYAQSGTLTTNLPINWINFRLYWGTSTGVEDPTDNFEVSSMTISALTLSIQQAGTNVLLTWPTNVPGFNLVSSPTLVNPVWSPVSTQPAVVNGQNVVTNAIVGGHQFFQLQQ